MVRDLDVYREVIDLLVAECRDGQGQIAARRVRHGVWNSNADRDQVAYNDLLKRMSASDRDTCARMLAEEFVGGVHEALRILHDAGVEPFDDGYEGSPYHDFVGRLDGWEWPEMQ